MCLPADLVKSGTAGRSILPGVRKLAGFTLVELVTTMIILGIMAVAILPRFTNRQTFDELGFHDRIKAAVEFARKAAIAQRRNVCVAVGAGTLTITQGVSFGAACTAALTDPTKGTPFSITPTGGVALSSTLSPITFDAQGSTPVNATLTVGTRTINVFAGTGYVQ